MSRNYKNKDKFIDVLRTIDNLWLCEATLEGKTHFYNYSKDIIEAVTVCRDQAGDIPWPEQDGESL